MEWKCFLGNFTATCWLSTFDSAATNDLLSNIDTSYRFDLLRPGRIVLSRRFPCFVFAAIDAGWSRSQKENFGLYLGDRMSILLDILQLMIDISFLFKLADAVENFPFELHVSYLAAGNHEK